MNQNIITRPHALLVVLLAVLIAFPNVTLAASRPSCSLEVETPKGEIDVRNRGDETILIEPGDEITIAWESDDADEATLNDDEIDTEGEDDFSPEETTTYLFSFENGNRSAECELTVQVVEGDFIEDTLSTTASRTTIKGTAEGTKTVQLILSEEDGGKTVFRSKTLRVKDGKWSSRITKTLKEGQYDVTLLGDRRAELNVIATDTFTIGDKKVVDKDEDEPKKDDSKAVSSNTTFVVESIPLLVGGKTKVNMSVPISYFQAINVGTSVGVVEDVKVKHVGTAPSSAIVGFTITDDQSLTNVVHMPSNPATLFKDGVATIPLDATIAGRQMRLFTVRALLSPTAFAHYGKYFQLSVAGVETNAKERATYPLPGTTWTIGF